MSGINENQFWLGLYKIVNDVSREIDPTLPFDKQLAGLLETVAQKVFPVGDWYRVRGAEDPEPLPAEPPLNMFIIGVFLGNYLAWQSGVKFGDRLNRDS